RWAASRCSSRRLRPRDECSAPWHRRGGEVLGLRGRERPQRSGDMTDLRRETAEGAQEIRRRHETAPDLEAIEEGAVLRGVKPGEDIDVEITDDETMIINMGPQHPSTHGVLRLMLELDGETVL